jgi:hypothetical protein
MHRRRAAPKSERLEAAATRARLGRRREAAGRVKYSWATTMHAARVSFTQRFTPHRVLHYIGLYAPSGAVQNRNARYDSWVPRYPLAVLPSGIRVASLRGLGAVTGDRFIHAARCCCWPGIEPGERASRSRCDPRPLGTQTRSSRAGEVLVGHDDARRPCFVHTAVHTASRFCSTSGSSARRGAAHHPRHRTGAAVCGGAAARRPRRASTPFSRTR